MLREFCETGFLERNRQITPRDSTESSTDANQSLSYPQGKRFCLKGQPRRRFLTKCRDKSIQQPSADSRARKWVISHSIQSRCMGWEEAFASPVSKIKSEVHLQCFLSILMDPRLALNSLCSRGWPETPDLPASIPWVLGPQACVIVLGLYSSGSLNPGLCVC